MWADDPALQITCRVSGNRRDKAAEPLPKGALYLFSPLAQRQRQRPQNPLSIGSNPMGATIFKWLYPATAKGM